MSAIINPQVTVSIITPSHRPAMLRECMDSIDAQDFDQNDYEHIIKRSTKYWPEKINEAAAASRATHLLMVCDDDKLKPRCLSEMVKKAREGNDIVFASVDTFGDYRRRVDFSASDFRAHDFSQGPPFWITSLVDRAKWMAVGGLDTTLKYQDWALWYELWKLGATAACAEGILWEYRQHAGQGSLEVNRDEALAQIRTKYPELMPKAA